MPKSILIADDSASIRQMVQFSLKAGDYAVTQAADGGDALEKAEGSKFDMVITDLDMPVMNGIELTRQIRALPGYSRVPIVILTTESDSGVKQRGKAAGATGWIIKPFRPHQLIEVIQKVLP